MKRLLSILFLLASFAIAGQAQTGCVELKEIDGSPDVKCVKTIRVTNGTLSCSGNVCTITISGGGGGSPGGADTNVQYNDSGSFGGVAGFVFDKTSKISLGVAGTSVGAVAFRNATSGTITLQPVTGALGTVTISMPATTGTMTVLGNTTTGSGSIVLANTPTLITPVLGAATGTSLTVTGNVQVGVAALYKFGGSNSFSYTDGVGPKWTDGNTVADLIFNVQSLSANRTVTWPDASGTATLLGNSSTGSGAVVLATTPTIATPSFTTGFTIGGTAATGTIPRGNGTNFVASTYTMAAPGTSGNVLTSDGTNWTSAAPSGGGITVGTTTIASGTNTRVLYNNAGVVGEYPVTGSTNVVLSGSPTIVTPAITTSATVTNNALGTTPAAGVELTNTTAAAAGAQQVSPAMVWTGQGWKTNATAASQTVNFQAYVLPVQGAANPTVTLQFENQINGGGWVKKATLNNSGGFEVFTGLGSSSGSVEIAPAPNSTIDFKYAGAIRNRLSGGTGTGNDFSILTSASLTEQARFAHNAGFYLVSGNVIGFNSVTSPTAFITSTAAANIKFGAFADAASPVAQTLSVQNVVAGTSNTAGANWTHAASRGTGTGAGGDIIFQTAPAGSSGTSQNTLVTAFTVKGDGAVQLKSVTFTNLPSVANGYLIYCSDCTLASPCASGGSGALAKGINGAWVCN